MGKRLDEGSRYFRFCCNPASCNNTLALSLCPRTKRTKSIVRLSLCGAHWEFFKPILYVERGAKEWHYYKSVQMIRRGRKLDVHPFHLREPLVGWVDFFHSSTEQHGKRSKYRFFFLNQDTLWKFRTPDPPTSLIHSPKKINRFPHCIKDRLYSCSTVSVRLSH